jgi:hypothetical protein
MRDTPAKNLLWLIGVVCFFTLGLSHNYPIIQWIGCMGYVICALIWSYIAIFRQRNPIWRFLGVTNLGGAVLIPYLITIGRL